MSKKTIIIATRNAHKTLEIQAMLGANIEILTLRDFPKAPEVVEDQGTFAGNATKKAVVLANYLAGRGENWFVLADDSGLEVDALEGAPGVHSARFAAGPETTGNAPDAANNAKLQRLLAVKPRPWTARFRCVLALAAVPEERTETALETCLMNEAELGVRLFEGVSEGQIVPEARGAHGFGYDPYFMPDGQSKTFAELGDETKNQISHRARAMEKLKAALET